jgi:hypothetical protein
LTVYKKIFTLKRRGFYFKSDAAAAAAAAATAAAADAEAAAVEWRSSQNGAKLANFQSQKCGKIEFWRRL